MDARNTQNTSGATQSLSAHLLSIPPAPRYETASARSTRMIIDSASYETTPSHSPPNELCHVFSPYDAHRKVPDVVALTEADKLLRQQQLEPHQEPRKHITANTAPAASQGSNEERIAPPRDQHRYGIIPPYMLERISASEAAGPQARASAEQTLLSSRPTKDHVVTHDASTAPASRQVIVGDTQHSGVPEAEESL